MKDTRHVRVLRFCRPLLPRPDTAFVPEIAVVGADGLQGAISKGFPQGFMVFFVADGRRTDIFGTLKTGRAQVLITGDIKILNAGFAHDRITEFTSTTNGINGGFAGDMHNIERAIRKPSEYNRAVGGFTFDFRRAGRIMVNRIGFTFGQKLLA